ncbi:hypothetical protein [Candidatus Regiella insecticola]|uniref:hypothetical protein n=1 Tax=Candidatus Regiella insecticola TaxID=138073 RepID=UPI00068216F3|nr:hypothetical protein [Candidatus Regiella insecticola]
MCEEINAYLSSRKLFIKRGGIVGATRIHVPGSTKNRQNGRDSDMKAAGKGNQCYFGMKVHIGVDTQTGLGIPCWESQQMWPMFYLLNSTP